METLVANFAGKVRREKLHGRDYLVAPVTILVPGVLNGSQGPLYYPVEECQANPSAWNGMPLVLNHPQRGSARIPSYIDTNGLGTLFNVDFVTDRLKGEAWFDIEKANKVDDRLVNLIERGEKIELSTGLGVNNEQGEGIYKNRSYVGVARDFKPDHLAILLDERGACSLNDGCGVNNKEADVTTNAAGAWKTINGAKVFVEGNIITKGPSHLRGKYVSKKSDKKAPAEGAEKGTSKHIPKDLEAQADAYVKAAIAKGRINKNDAVGADFLRDEFKRNKVKRSIDSEASKKARRSSTNWRRGMAKAHKASLDKQAEREEKGSKRTNNSQSPLSTLEKPMCKQVLIDQLVENSDGLWSEEDREHLDAFSEDKLKALVANCEMNSGSMNEDDDSEGEAAVAKTKGKKAATPVANTATTPVKTALKMADLPAELQEVFNAGREALVNKKTALVDRLVANFEGEAKAAKQAALMKRDIAHLEDLVSFLPPQPVVNTDSLADFFGAGAGAAPVHNSGKGPTPMSDFNYDFSK